MTLVRALSSGTPSGLARLLGSAVLLVAGSGTGWAQAVEQHPAPVLHGAQTAAISTSALETRLTDATPFGVDLAGVMVVDVHANGQKVRSKTGAGVDTALAGVTAQSPEFRVLLQKYVGKPLSYVVIGAIEAEITKFYRDNGRSLVLVTVPPQEVTSGVLQVNVNTFVLEATAVEGAAGRSQGYVAGQIRVKPGQEVDTATLLEDVNWLNLNPFRHVSVVFEPGKAADSTKLTLQVQNGRPWSAYVGLSNSGSKDTGILRVFGGFNMSALPWQDHQLSYQFNGAPEGLLKGNVWETGRDKGYVSHALSYFVPITTSGGFRMKVTLGANHISSYAVPGSGFSTATTTNGLTEELAFPLPRISGTWNLLPELYLGLAQDYYDRTRFLDGGFVDDEHTNLKHLELGLRSSLNGKLFDKATHGDFDIALFTGRQRTVGKAGVTYSYAKASISQEIMLDPNHSVGLRFGGQYSPRGLHALEQLSLGGDGTVRGYPSSAASSQTAASASVEYRMAPISVPIGKASGKFRPHVFLDAGFAEKGKGATLSPVEHMAAIGFGGELAVGENLIARFEVADALVAAGLSNPANPDTKAGTLSLAFQVTARF